MTTKWFAISEDIICLLIAFSWIILCVGEPDLLDAIIGLIGRIGT